MLHKDKLQKERTCDTLDCKCLEINQNFESNRRKVRILH